MISHYTEYKYKSTEKYLDILLDVLVKQIEELDIHFPLDIIKTDTDEDS